MARVGQVLGRGDVAETEPQPEREHHPHHRGDEGRPPQVPQKAQIGLQARQQQQEGHPDAAEGVQ